MNTLNLLLNRFQDPGSLRSLVLVLFLVKGQAVADATIDAVVNAALMLIGTVSFFMKPVSAPAAVAVAESAAATSEVAAAKAHEAATSVQTVADDVRDLAATVGSLASRLK